MPDEKPRLPSASWLAGLFCSLLLFSGVSQAAPDGKSLYEDHCSVCHQTRGKGGIGLPLSAVKLASVSDDYLRKTIRLGRPGRIMPAFEALSDAQVDAIVSHVRSWYDDPGMTFSDKQVKGDVAHGAQVFETHCVACHGRDGSGEGAGTGVTLSRERSFLVMPPAISNVGFLKAAPDEMIRHTVVNGRSDSIMPAFKGTLSGQDIDDVVAFVRSFEAKAEEEEDMSEMIEASHVVESPYDFQTTIDNVRAALQGSNFRIFPDRFLEQGLTDEFSQNTKQISIRFCNFKELYQMLNIEPRLGVVLPCRITVMEREDGSVLLIAPNMQVITHWFNNDELVRLGGVMDETIQEILDEVTL